MRDCRIALLSFAIFLSILQLALPAEVRAEGYTVHEWGYFVENSGRDAREVALTMPKEVPSFRTWSTDASRARALAGGVPTVPRVTSIATEPYVYFYSDTSFQVDVRVEFPGGAPLFWWPVAMVGERSLEWKNVRVFPRKERVDLHDFSGLDVDRMGLERARQVGSSPIKAQNRYDKYLFYEGSMSTDTILARRESWDGLHLENVSDLPISHVLVFRPGEKRAIHLESLAANAEVVIEPGRAGSVDANPESLALLLAGAGLFDDEASVMARSVWETGFLETAGTKVLYLLSREAYDRIYPISLDPAPATVVRIGLVLSFDLDHAIEATLEKMGGTYLRRGDIQADLRDQLRRIVGSRVANLEPLSDSMRTALRLDDPRMAEFRKLVARDFQDEDARRAEVERLIEEGFDTSRPRAERSRILDRLLARLRPYLYAGCAWTPAIRDLMARRKQVEEVVGTLGVDPGLVR